jgi:hypothetical protein
MNATGITSCCFFLIPMGGFIIIIIIGIIIVVVYISFCLEREREVTVAVKTIVVVEYSIAE